MSGGTQEPRVTTADGVFTGCFSDVVGVELGFQKLVGCGKLEHSGVRPSGGPRRTEK